MTDPLHYPVVIEPEGTYRLIRFPQLAGADTFADLDEDVEAIARDAMEAWLEGAVQDGEVVPPPVPPALSGPAEVRYIAVPEALAAALRRSWGAE